VAESLAAIEYEIVEIDEWLHSRPLEYIFRVCVGRIFSCSSTVFCINLAQ